MAGGGPAAGTQTEVESTLEVPTGAEEAVEALLRGDDLAGLPGVARVATDHAVALSATYHDTAALHLLRARATLRRRTGGDDAGWHLKLPGREDGARTEVHEPLGDDDAPVPERLVALSRSRHRGRPLRPVATLRTQRCVVRLLDDADRVLAEVADDHVRTEVADELVAPGREAAAAWHEVEVELVEGDRALLAAATGLLRAAGAEPPPTTSKLARALTTAGALEVVAARRAVGAAPADGTALAVVVDALWAYVYRLVEEEPLVRLDVEDSVHRMRVATRRLRSTLATFRPVLGRGATEPLRASLKELGAVLGGARDAEVLGARVCERLAGLPPELVPGPVGRRLQGELDGAYERERTVAVAHLDSEDHARLLEDLVRLCEDPTSGRLADAPAARTTRRRARHAWRRLEDRLAAVPPEAGQARDEALHEVRKAAKRVRYAGEALTGLHGRAAERLAERAEDLRELLGEHQDATVAADELRRVALRAFGDGENTFGYGVLTGLELAGTRGLGPDDPELVRAVRRLRRAAARWFG